MKSKIPVLLPIEVKKRELDGKLLLALHLISEEYPVIIGDRGGIARELCYLKKCIYLGKSLSVDYIKTFQDIHKNNGKVLVLFEEGAMVAWPDFKYDEIESFYPKEVLHLVDYLFTYSTDYNNLLIETFQELNNDNLYVTGNMRFDLHRPKYRRFYEDKIEKLSSKYGKYILIDTNFSFGNHFISEEYLRAEIERNKDFTKPIKDVILNLITVKKDTIQKYISLAIEIAKEFKKYTIIVRPHPGEKSDIYLKQLAGISNIVVTNEGTATAWIWGAEILIHHDCTTAVEAYISGKPAISYTPNDDKGARSWLPVYVSHHVEKEEEVIDSLKKQLRKGKNFELIMEKKKSLGKHLINFEEESAKLIVKKVNEIFHEEKETPDNYFALGFKERIKRYIKRSRYLINWYRRKYFRKGDIYTLAFQGLSKSEVNIKLKKFQKIEDMNFRFDIKKLGINTFLIRKSNN